MKLLKSVRRILGYLLGSAIFGGGIPYLLALSARQFPGTIFGNAEAGGMVGALIICAGAPFPAFAYFQSRFAAEAEEGEPSVAESPRTTQLIQSGPYRLTRNPVAFGAFCLYLAVAFILNSVAALTGALLWLAGWLVYLKTVAEPRLERKFGAEFREYRNQVPPLIPWELKRTRE
jgi:protein-S-isoprenylcysteine O-methyltransferase Ste14